MAAYAAVVSLHHTINAFLLNSTSRVSVSSLQLAHEEASSLLHVLERLNGSNRSRSSMERVDALEGDIRDFAHKLEDSLEFHELKQHQQLEDGDDDEGMMRQEIHSFCEAAKRLEEDYHAELSRDDDDDHDEDDTTTGFDFGVEMIGRSDLLHNTLGRHVLRRMRPDDRFIFAFWGEQGSGSRVVMKTVFDNAREAGEFERWGWARVGREYELKHVMMSLIAQVEPCHVGDDELLVDASEDRLSKYLCKALEDQRYMIVLEDVEDMKLLEYLLTTSFLDQSNGSVVLVTTNSMELVQRCCDFCYKFEMPDIYEEELWLHVRLKLFGWESIPAELEVAGKEILRNCGRLFIPIAKTLIFLSKSDKTLEQWSKLAADKENPIFTVADEILERIEFQEEIKYCDTEIAALASGLVNQPSRAEVVNTVMYPERFFSKMQIISFFGMAGIGKTIFVKNVIKDGSIMSCFHHLVWIPMGPSYRTEEILIDILAQIYPHKPRLHMTRDEKLIGNLCAQVSNKRCLIVLDDLYSQTPLHHLREIFPAIKGTILVTTRLPKVAKFERDDTAIEIQLLGEEESWRLLSRKVFDGEPCPPELEKVGRKIATKCDGLPLLILTVAYQLLKVEQTQEYWNNVASGKEKSIFKNAHDQISEALLPSYHNLPQHLKPCFLYVGVFLEKYDIPTSNLTNLWISEGFLKPNLSQLPEDFVA